MTHDWGLRALLARAVDAFPRGGMLPAENWRRRHTALALALLWHTPLLFGYGLVQGRSIAHAAVDIAVPLLLGLAAFWSRLSRGVRSMAVATGLIACSVTLVHLSNGLIEAHFHFFVMVALLSLYQDWRPFLVAIGLTVVEHGVTGILAPHSVYNHADAWAHPWKWAFIHGGFVVAASVASITAWSVSEADHRRMKADTARLHAQREAMLSHEAHHDQLTGLPNRRMVLDHLQAASARSRASSTMLGVLFIDLDRFKHVNDTYGHLIGDAVLKVTADRLRTAVRGSDMAARLGGDEFVVVYEGLHDPVALDTATERIQRALRGPIHVDDGLSIEIGASIGHVLATGDDHWEELIERADLDMYRVKHLGRGDITVHTAEATSRPTDSPGIPGPR
jgi:diguanylate cyclase (GGDEF)-like protein